MKNPLPFLLPDFLKDKTILSHHPISGGDINEAFQIKTTDGDYFLKQHRRPPTSDFLEIEAKGLAILQKTKTIKIPTVFSAGNFDGTAYLLMEYLPSEIPKKIGWENLGKQLANLHKTTQENFGLDHANFIGSLPQHNHYQKTWSEFYITERLEPQIKMAMDQQLLEATDLTLFEKLFLQIESICPKESPALIHGDLWSGNFLITKNQTPVLIDPAVSYAHREIDLAMSHLFGGFDPIFYEAYNATYPWEAGLESRIPLYQLYYLLVHLNLFGTGYLDRVRATTKMYS